MFQPSFLDGSSPICCWKLPPVDGETAIGVANRPTQRSQQFPPALLDQVARRAGHEDSANHQQDTGDDPRDLRYDLVIIVHS